VLKVDAAQ